MSLDRLGRRADYSGMISPENTPVDLVRIDRSQNMARFYGIGLQPTLFGEVSVVRSWGRIGTRGRTMSVTFGDATQAAEACDKLEQQKLRRGYVEVNS